MSNYRTKITRVTLALLASVLILTFAITLCANYFKDRATRKLSKLFSYDIKIKTIFYIFPKNILLTDVTLTPKEKNGQSTIIQIPRVLLQFSLKDLLFKHQFSTTTAIIDQSSMPYTLLTSFLHNNANVIFSLAQELPKADTRVVIKEAKVYFTPPEAKPYYSTVDFEVTLTNNRLRGHGAVYNSLDRLPIRINLEGMRTSQGIKVSQCAFRHLYAQTNFWAELRSGELWVNGYAFLNKRQPLESHSILNKLFQQKNTVPQSTGNTVDIVDFDLQGKFIFPKFQIKQLSFILNNAPVQIKGNLSYIDALGLDLSLVYQNAPSGPNRINTFKELNLLLKGTVQNGTYDGIGNLNIIFDNSENSNFSLQNITANSKGLSIYHDRYRRFTIQLREGDVTLHSAKDENVIAFDDLNLFLNWQAERFKVIDVASAMYNGHLQGRIWIDVIQSPVRITAMALLKNLEVNQMASLVKHFQKIQGKLNGKLNIQSHPNFNLTSELKIQNGELENFDFFTWMASTFAMPSLINVPFKDLSADYSLNSRGNGISDIKLNSSTVGMTGYYNVDKNNLVSSKISLSLDRIILQESPKFRAILKMFDQDVASLPFDFQLSGNQDAMNFQWLQTDFKERIQKRIPNFIERAIDRRIDAILQGKIDEEPAEPTPTVPSSQ